MPANDRVKPKRFNIIDIVILLIVIFAAAAILLRLGVVEQISLWGNEEYELEFQINDIQEKSQDYLKPNEVFYINIDSTSIGTIKEILDIRPAFQYNESSTGELLKSDLPGRIFVSGVLLSKGKGTKEGFMLNGNMFVAPGKEFLVHTSRLEVNITIIDVKKAGT
ncbi:hypothetical protein FACS1894219_00620 [Clostridia bacterium]|nr:hypothetical protein FACS1894219_00620 [Clostridia bacterium]